MPSLSLAHLVKQKVRVKCDYKREGDTELGCKRDYILLVTKAENGWLHCQKIPLRPLPEDAGWVPGNYVELHTNDDVPLSASMNGNPSHGPFAGMADAGDPEDLVFGQPVDPVNEIDALMLEVMQGTHHFQVRQIIMEVSLVESVVKVYMVPVPLMTSCLAMQSEARSQAMSTRQNCRQIRIWRHQVSNQQRIGVKGNGKISHYWKR